MTPLDIAKERLQEAKKACFLWILYLCMWLVGVSCPAKGITRSLPHSFIGMNNNSGNMETKICNRCGKELPLTDEYFYRNGTFTKDGFKRSCKVCMGFKYKKPGEFIVATKEGNAVCSRCGREFPFTTQYFIGKRNKLKHVCKECRGGVFEENPRRRLNPVRRDDGFWICKRCGIEKELNEDNFFHSSQSPNGFSCRCKECSKNGKDKTKVNEYAAKKAKNDPSFRIAKTIRSRIWSALRGHSKYKRSLELLGCSINFLRSYFESLFLDGMSWDNYGNGGWHIDHIRPCVSFDLTDPAQQQECFHYTNLQPLWAKDNFKKGAKW